MFRNAIIAAKENFRFSCKDRMHRFPHGCCDDASDLLGYYLLHKYDIRTIQITGTYRDGIPENTINHAWLKAEDETDIDITVDQFISMTNKPGFSSANDNFYSLSRTKSGMTITIYIVASVFGMIIKSSINIWASTQILI